MNDTHNIWRDLNRGAVYDREASALLLQLVYEVQPDGHFDEVNIGTRACDDARLMAALAFLRPVRDRCRWHLTAPSHKQIENWLKAIDGVEFGGLRLARHPVGWLVRCGGDAVIRTQALQAAASIIGHHVPNLPDLVAFLEFGGQRRIAAALRARAGERSAERRGRTPKSGGAKPKR